MTFLFSITGQYFRLWSLSCFTSESDKCSLLNAEIRSARSEKLSFRQVSLSSRARISKISFTDLSMLAAASIRRPTGFIHNSCSAFASSTNSSLVIKSFFINFCDIKSYYTVNRRNWGSTPVTQQLRFQLYPEVTCTAQDRDTFPASVAGSYAIPPCSVDLIAIHLCRIPA
jgi:hypothetical protein